MKSNYPRISVITATHNTPYSTLYAISSLLKFNPDFHFRIHIVDEGEYGELTEKFLKPFCYVYKKDPSLKNLGWTFHGTAISMICDDYLEDDFFLTLDSDLYSTDYGGIKCLYNALTSDSANYAASMHLVDGKYLTSEWEIGSDKMSKENPYEYFYYMPQSCMWYSLRRNDDDFKRVHKEFKFDTAVQCGIGAVVGGYLVKRSYDTGGLVSTGMRVLGRKGVAVPEVDSLVVHGGAVSTTKGKYESMKNDLKKKCAEINMKELKNYDPPVQSKNVRML